jgi:gentisate 1,2-dioxygenase
MGVAELSARRKPRKNEGDRPIGSRLGKVVPEAFSAIRAAPDFSVSGERRTAARHVDRRSASTRRAAAPPDRRLDEERPTLGIRCKVRLRVLHSKVTRMTTPTPQQLAHSGSLDELYRQLEPIRLGAGWAKPTPSLWAEPKKSFQPAVWSYAQAKGALDAAGRLINTELAERRNLIMQNPAGGGYATSRTIVAAYQMIMPGEKARSHRHTPNALRLIVDAEPGAYTIVNGERLAMMPGDVVLTPNWCWHGHGNDSRANAYWLDVLDVPLVHLLEPMFFEPHPDEFEQEKVVASNSPMHFSWADTQRRLAEAGAHSNGQPAEIALGDPALATMALTMIGLKAGQRTTSRKVMANSVFGVAQGSGSTETEGRTLSWSRGDVIVVPAWHEHVHRSEGGAVLFRVTDEPTMRKLGFLREDTPAAH